MDAVGGNVATLYRVRMSLHALQNFVRVFRSESDRYPDSLREIDVDRASAEYYQTDPWGRPYLYEHSERDFRIATLGRDGEPGGYGLDADISTDNLRPNAARLTLWQFLFEVNSQVAVACSILSGFLAGALTFRELWSRRRSGVQKISWWATIAVWVFLSSMAAGAIASLDLVPNGH